MPTDAIVTLDQLRCITLKNTESRTEPYIWPALIRIDLEAHETVIAAARTAIEKTAENQDWGSNDLLIGDVLRTNEKQVWFIAEHLVETPLVRG